MMIREKVTSSNIISIGYDASTKRMEIEFGRAGSKSKVYTYKDVPVGVYQQFRFSPSVGKFFQENIRDKYQFEK